VKFTADVENNPEGTVIILQGASPIRGLPRFSIRDLNTNRFLGKAGWVKSLSYVPLEARSEGDKIYLFLTQKVGEHIADGMHLEIADVGGAFRAVGYWPSGDDAFPFGPTSPKEVVAAPVATLPTTFSSHERALEEPSPVTVATQSRASRYGGWKVLVFLACGIGIGFGASHLGLPTAEADLVTIARGTRDIAPPSDAEREQLAVRLAEQEQLIARLRVENDTLKTQPNSRETASYRQDLAVARREIADLASKNFDLNERLRKVDEPSGGQTDNREMGSLRQDLATARRDLVSLTDRNSELNEQLRTQTQTIAEFAVGQRDRDNQIKELQQRLGLASLAGEENDYDVTRSTSAVSRFGAIAASGNGTVILTEIDFASPRDASLDAITACRNFGGGFNCNVRQTFEDTCVAIARVKPTNKGSRWSAEDGTSESDAGKRAKSRCEREHGKECQVTRAACPS